MTSESNRVRSSSEWRAILSEQDRSRAAELYRSLASVLGSNDVSELLSLMESPDQREHSAAIGLLMIAMKKHKLMLSDSQRSQVLRSLPRLLRTFPDSAGMAAFHMFQLLDQSGAEDFLLNGVQPENLSGGDLGIYAASLNLLTSSPAVVEKLAEFSRRSDGLGDVAQRQLERRGILSPNVLQATAEEWRRTRSRESLNRLFNAFISHQVERPIDPVLQLLGAPSEHKGSRYFYHTIDGLTLFLEQDDRGRLKSMRIK